jgi:hypothetical protein
MELFAYKLPKGVEAEELLKYNHRPNFDTFLHVAKEYSLYSPF